MNAFWKPPCFLVSPSLAQPPLALSVANVSAVHSDCLLALEMLPFAEMTSKMASLYLDDVFGLRQLSLPLAPLLSYTANC